MLAIAAVIACGHPDRRTDNARRLWGVVVGGQVVVAVDLGGRS